jgi:hypothetical protein
MLDKYQADLDDLMFLASDGSMMCESHQGQEWTRCEGGPDCIGPGTPWQLSGKTNIKETLARERMLGVLSVKGS